MTSGRGHPMGTTFIEMLIVVALVGILALLVLPKWPQHQPPRADVVTRIGRARSMAVQSFRPVTIWISANDTVVSITAMPDGSTIESRALPTSVQFRRPSDAHR